jgi:hypothetical protein
MLMSADGPLIAHVPADELFKIPNLLVLANDAFYIVKPLRRRFWMAKAAFSDADQIAQTVQAAAWEISRS